MNGYRLIHERSQDRNLSVAILQFSRFTEAALVFIFTKTPHLNRYSSAAERLNTPYVYHHDFIEVRLDEWLSPYKRKVTGSKPVAGIIHFTPLQKRVVIAKRLLNTAYLAPPPVEERSESAWAQVQNYTLVALKKQLVAST